MEKETLKRVKKYSIFIVLIVAAVVANRFIQTHLGEQAIIETGFQHISLDKAIEQAKSSNKKVLVDMSAIWCPTCRKLDQQVFSNSQVQDAIKEKYVFTRIEYTEQEGEELMSRYKVKGFPTLLILDGEGALLQHLPVTFSPEEFIASIK